MANIGIFHFFLCLTFSHCLSQSLDTYPIRNEGEENIIVQVSDDDVAVNVYCRVDSVNDTVTQWSINGTIVGFNSSTFEGLGAYSYLSAAEDSSTNTNLSVSLVDFSKPFRLPELTCHSATDSRTFLIGTPTGPKLLDAATTYDVAEGSSFFLDLEDVTPFPPYNNPLTSTWLANRAMINDSQITFGDYNISIGSVWRGLSGTEFNLTVSTNLGSDTESFKLNVQYSPEAEQTFNNQVYHAEIGEDVTLIAAEGLGGNPVPNTQWFGPTNAIIQNTMDKFIFTKVGRLQIKNITESDLGKYRFFATNGIEMDLWINQTLVEASPPGAPINVSVTNIQDESATLVWSEPSTLGAPPLNKYSIALSGFDESSVDSATTMLELTSLIPGESYNVTVTANSEYDFMNSDDQSTSDLVTFTTLRGVPRVDSQTTVTAASGNLVVSFFLKHTGGYDPSNITIEAFCGLAGSFQLPTEGKIGSDELDPDVEGLYSSECMCVNDQLTGQLTVDDLLTAGSRYVCVVVAGNSEGDFYYNTLPATAEIGIPSVPEVLINASPGSITITIQSPYPGVPAGDGTYSFNVVVLNEQDEVVYNMSFTGMNDTTFTVDDLLIGTYLVEAFGQNRYGASAIGSAMVNVTMEASVSPTIEEDNSQVLSLYAIVVIAVGGTLLIFCIFITITMIAVCINYKRKKDSVSFYKNEYKMTRY